MTQTDADEESPLPLRESARVPFERPQWPWLALLPALTVGLDLLRPVLAGAPRAVLTLAFIAAASIIVLRLAARCLLAAVAGARTAAERAGQDVPPGLVGRLIVLWLLAMAPASAVLTGASTGPLPALVAIAILAALPLATLMLARTVSLPDALDPLHWRELVAETGAGLIARLTAVLFVLALGYVALAALPLPEAIGWLKKGVVQFYWIWATLAWFDLAGRVRRARPERPKPAGTPPEPVDGLFERVMARGGTRPEHRRLAEALEMAGDRKRLLEHGEVHVNALLDGFGQPGSAVEAAAALLDHDPRFALADTESMYRLIRASRRHGYPALTIRLCGNYLDRFPRSFKRDEVRLIACEAAAAGAGEDRRATAGWLAELIGARLAADQRERLKRIVPAFHAEGLIRKPGG